MPDALTAIATHAVSLPDALGDASWVQLLPAGKFSGRDGRGPYDAGTQAEMQAIVAASLKRAGNLDLVVDYDHQSDFAANDKVGGRAAAAGWIKELQARADGIWGRVEWTPAAAAALRDREYRYLSPVFAHQKSGKILGLLRAALTNTPNLDLVAVASQSRDAFPQPTGVPMDKILAALGLPQGAGEDAVVTAINAYLTSSTAIARAAGLTETAKPAEILTAVQSIVADRQRVAVAAGLATDAKADDVVTALQSARAGASFDPAKYVPIAIVSDLQKEVKALQSSNAAEKADEAVAAAIRDRKLSPALKEWGLALHKSDPTAFANFLAGAPEMLATQMSQTRRDPNAPAALSDEEQIVVAAMGLDAEAFRKTQAAIAQSEGR